jgi:hypothetical protein
MTQIDTEEHGTLVGDAVYRSLHGPAKTRLMIERRAAAHWRKKYFDLKEDIRRSAQGGAPECEVRWCRASLRSVEDEFCDRCRRNIESWG